MWTGYASLNKDPTWYPSIGETSEECGDVLGNNSANSEIGEHDGWSPDPPGTLETSERTLKSASVIDCRGLTIVEVVVNIGSVEGIFAHVGSPDTDVRVSVIGASSDDTPSTIVGMRNTNAPFSKITVLSDGGRTNLAPFIGGIPAEVLSLILVGNSDHAPCTTMVDGLKVVSHDESGVTSECIDVKHIDASPPLPSHGSNANSGVEGVPTGSCSLSECD